MSSSNSFSGRTTTGFRRGMYYTVYADELEPLAEKLGISVNTYCSLQDILIWFMDLLDRKGIDNDFDLHSVISKIVKIIKGAQ